MKIQSFTSFILLVIIFFAVNSCTENKRKEPINKLKINDQTNLKRDNVNYLDPRYFNLVVDYLHKNGKREEINVSSIAQGNLMITYCSYLLNDFELSSDHTNRIYLTKDKQSFGNMLLENGKVRAEINYGIIDPNPKDSALKKEKIWEIYKKLVDLAVNN